MKLLVFTLLYFLSQSIVCSQVTDCEYIGKNELIEKYSIYNIDSLKNDKKMVVINTFKSSINQADLEKIIQLKNDSIFNKIVVKYALENDFSFPSIDDMFSYCNEKASFKYLNLKSDLDSSFREKRLKKILKVDFFYFNHQVNSEIYIYSVSYCDVLSWFSLNNSMLLSPSNPFEEKFNKKLLGIEVTSFYTRYIIPVTFKSNVFYMSVFVSNE